MNVVPDTNVWIRWLRERRITPPDGVPRARLLVSTIVLQESWAGVSDTAQDTDLRRLYNLALRSRTLLNPPAAAWVLAGQALKALASRRAIGSQRLRVLRNDALLAASVLVNDGIVLTENRRDFALIAEVMPVRVSHP